MKKKAFISYSMKDSEQYVLTLLSNLLGDEGFIVDSSYDSLNPGQTIEHAIRKKISDSSLFIGIITESGRNNSVLREWQQATTLRIPSLMLVEDTVQINSPLLQKPNVIRFNRYYPEEAINRAVGKIQRARSNPNEQEGENVLGWVLGGLAILALIKLLSDE